MNIVRNWTTTLPEYCGIESIRFESEWIILDLYGKGNEAKIALNTINGKIQKREVREPGLKGFVEKKANEYIISIMKGCNNKLLSKVIRGLNVKLMCKQDLCIIAHINRERVLTITLISRDGSIIDELKIGKVYEFDIASTASVLALSTIGVNEETTLLLLVDPSTKSVIERLTGFGGFLLPSLDFIIVYSYIENKPFSKIYTENGEELFEIDGLPTLPPYTPFPRHTNQYLCEPHKIVFITKNDIRVVNSRDFTLENILPKPPLMRGVVDVDSRSYVITGFSKISGLPLLTQYLVTGDIKWFIHATNSFSYALASQRLIAIYSRSPLNETRIYALDDNGMPLYIDSFAPNVFPLIVKENTVILTDIKMVSSYSIE
ncbi:MAG: hypothetical protein ABWW65_01420 [Thermoprotei archaeon]